MAYFREIYEEFEKLVRELMEANGFSIDNPFRKDHARDLGYDFLAQSPEGILFAVEVKFYRTLQAQRDLLLVASARLGRIQDPPIMGRLLVVSAIVPDSLRQTIEEYGVNVVDAANLSSWASVNPALAERLDSTLESKSIVESKSVVIEAKTSTATANLLSSGIVTPIAVGSNLCSELRLLGCGKKHWQKYEDLCERILRYLFSADLHGWYQQKWIDGGLARYDLICRVTAVTKLWALVYNHLSSQYVVFEFKNYCAPITQGQILTTEKYLHERALRRVAFVLTRKGEDGNAKKIRQGAIRDAGKLMLVLTDDDLCKMLKMRDKGDDPSDHLFDLADEFLISLPR